MVCKNNKIPWYFSEDLKYFIKLQKELEIPIIMGRKHMKALKLSF